MASPSLQKSQKASPLPRLSDRQPSLFFLHPHFKQAKLWHYQKSLDLGMRKLFSNPALH